MMLLSNRKIFVEDRCHYDLWNFLRFHFVKFLTICEHLATSDWREEKKMLVGRNLNCFVNKDMPVLWSFPGISPWCKILRVAEAKIPTSSDCSDLIHADSLMGKDWCNQTLSPPSAKSAAAWPSPCNTHFVVNSPSTPTGPRAWIRAVEIPTLK